MRTIFIFLMLLFLNTTGSAATRIIFLNGINVDDDGRQASVDQIKKVLRDSGFLQKFGGDETIIESLPNLADGLFSDVAELVRQAKYSSEALTIARLVDPAATAQSLRYREQLGDLYAQRIVSIATSTDIERRILSFSKYVRDKVYERVITNGDKVIVVAHSQGNFFAEAVNAYLMATATADERIKLDRGLRFVGAASVAASTPNGRYISAMEDGALILQASRTTLIANYSLLDRNILLCTALERTIRGDLCYAALLFRDPLVHGFAIIYTSDLTDKTTGRTLASIVATLISDSFDEIQSVVRALYSITPIGDARPTAINDRGDIVGTCGQVACIRRAVDGIWRSIGTLGGPDSMPLAVDSAGRIVGSSSTEPSVGTHAFRYSGVLGSPLVDITKEFVGNEAILASQAVSIADSGFIAGNVTLGNLFTHAFLSINGVGQDLETLPGASASYAAKVNNSGTVVGYSNAVGGLPSAFIRPLGAAGMSEIPQLSGRLSAAMDINSAGTVVGIQWPGQSNADPYYGFIYSKNPQTGVETFADIKDANNQFVLVNAINNLGEVVGTKSSGAFIYSNGTIRDLNQLIPANSGWLIDGGTAINNFGQIVGQGLINGQRQAVLLTPVQ